MLLTRMSFIYCERKLYHPGETHSNMGKECRLHMEGTMEVNVQTQGLLALWPQCWVLVGERGKEQGLGEKNRREGLEMYIL